MNRFGLIFIVMGGVLGYIGYREWKLQSHSSPEPEQITLEALIKRGPEGNPHVEVTDFFFPGNFVATTKSNAWQQVYFPVEPLNKAKIAGQLFANLLGADAARITNAKAIFIINNVHDQQMLEKYIGDHETITGMVINSVRSLDSKAADLIRQNFPQTDFDKVVILEADRAPWSTGTLTLMLGGAVLLVILGLGSLLWRWISSREQPYRGPDTFTPPGSESQP